MDRIPTSPLSGASTNTRSAPPKVEVNTPYIPQVMREPPVLYICCKDWVRMGGENSRNSPEYYKVLAVLQSPRDGMTIPAGPCDLVAVSRIDGVMRAVKKSLLPPTNVTEEVTALHDMYLERKCIIAMIDEAHNTLRHLQRVESKKRGHRAARQTRVPRASAVAATTIAVATAVENVPCAVLAESDAKITHVDTV